MSAKEIKGRQRPMNVYVRRGSSAEKAFRKRAGSLSPKAIAPGIAPTPEHDLKYQGGKTIQDLRFMSFYIGGAVWGTGDIATNHKTPSQAKADPDPTNIGEEYFPGPPTSA